MAIRSAVKAVVLHNNQILVNRCRTKTGEVYYDLPGGGQNQFEAMEDAILREVLEETGYSIEIIRFSAVVEEIYDNTEVREHSFDYSHRIIHVFLAQLVDENPVECTETDFQQESTMWVSLDEADELPFRPTLLKGKIRDIIANGYTIAIIDDTTPVIADAQSALDLMATLRYEHECERLAISKDAISGDFFALSTGLAGEILQKFSNYHFKAAIYGDFSVYKSKPLHDFIYESNNGNSIFFTTTAEEALERLSAK